MHVDQFWDLILPIGDYDPQQACQSRLWENDGDLTFRLKYYHDTDAEEIVVVVGGFDTFGCYDVNFEDPRQDLTIEAPKCFSRATAFDTGYKTWEGLAKHTMAYIDSILKALQEERRAIQLLDRRFLTHLNI